MDNKHLCSYHSIEELFNPEREYNRNCAICSHATFSGHGLLMDKYNCEIASELNRKQQSTIDFCEQNNIDPDNLSVSTNFIVKCEAYDEISELNVVRNMEEMIDFMYKTFNMLDGWDGVCGYYGFEIPYDWDNDKAECTIYEYHQNGGTFDKVPKEREIVEYKTYTGFNYYGFYILPYRKYPNSYFDPFKLAKWCYVDPNTGNWMEMDDKPVVWRKTDIDFPFGEYIPNRRWFPDKG